MLIAGIYTIIQNPSIFVTGCMHGIRKNIFMLTPSEPSAFRIRCTFLDRFFFFSIRAAIFEHHVNRMATAYNKMKNSIEEKYAEQDYELEYYVTESGKIEELTKEKELDMLNQAYENHSNFMATSTEIWSELQDFTPSVVYHKESEQTANEQDIGENQENSAKSKEKGGNKNSAYQAFLSAIQSDNQKLSQQYSGDWKDLRLNLNVSDGDRKMLNGIWDYYAMESE